VVMGPQDEAFTDEGIRSFLSEIYTLAPQSDRVGCRLTGPRIGHRRGVRGVRGDGAYHRRRA
jgi:allophanate hydrolase subunit 2